MSNKRTSTNIWPKIATTANINFLELVFKFNKTISPDGDTKYHSGGQSCSLVNLKNAFTCRANPEWYHTASFQKFSVEDKYEMKNSKFFNRFLRISQCSQFGKCLTSTDKAYILSLSKLSWLFSNDISSHPQEQNIVNRKVKKNSSFSSFELMARELHDIILKTTGGVRRYLEAKSKWSFLWPRNVY